MGAFKDGFWLPIMTVLTGTFLTGVVAGRYTAPSSFATTKTTDCATTVDVVALRDQVVRMASERCMSVNTPVLNVNVYDSPNLGTKKVAKAGG